jgi:hypothetical protein
MRDLLILASHLVVAFVKLLRRGGVRAVAAESLPLKHQLLISNRSHHRAPNPTTLDLIVLALTTLFVSPAVLRSSPLSSSRPRYYNFHKKLVCEKYRRLFSSSSHRHKPGPKGPSAKLIAAIVEIKRRNPQFGCVRIAQQISHPFGPDRQRCIPVPLPALSRACDTPWPPNLESCSNEGWPHRNELRFWVRVAGVHSGHHRIERSSPATRRPLVRFQLRECADTISWKSGQAHRRVLDLLLNSRSRCLGRLSRRSSTTELVGRRG